MHTCIIDLLASVSTCRQREDNSFAILKYGCGPLKTSGYSDKTFYRPKEEKCWSSTLWLGSQFFSYSVILMHFFSLVLGSALPWLYGRRSCLPTILSTLSERFIFPQQEDQMKRIVLLWGFHFYTSNSCAELVVPAKFVALTNILYSLY